MPYLCGFWRFANAYIQFKLKGDIPYLLEINTRMSGGLQMTCEAENINIPNIALNKLLGKEIDWNLEAKERVVSYIEIPQIIR
jgi:biotin carboxylase